MGYFLLTGTPVFPGPSLVELCRQHVSAIPEPPSRRLGRAISPRLEALILRCLAKDRDERPAGAAAIDEELAQCDDARPWTRAEAESWWLAAETARGGDPAGAAAAATVLVAAGDAALETAGFDLPR